VAGGGGVRCCWEDEGPRGSSYAASWSRRARSGSPGVPRGGLGHWGVVGWCAVMLLLPNGDGSPGDADVGMWSHP
jgi:hypothetical protein